ncbi:MAG: hypothetical protein ACLSHG_12505 [Oscillospiraceae bacterium]
MRIVRPDGSLCDAGEEGEICVRGQGMMLGYYQMPEKTADVIRDGWYFTHDGAISTRTAISTCAAARIRSSSRRREYLPRGSHRRAAENARDRRSRRLRHARPEVGRGT